VEELRAMQLLSATLKNHTRVFRRYFIKELVCYKLFRGSWFRKGRMPH
jgi:hypothetical protein